MSLLVEKWLPVRRRSGERAWVAPDELGDPDIVAFAADRPDFNGALVQFAIGLLQTSAPLDDEHDWESWFSDTPDAATLAGWFADVAPAFVYDGPGARFMQDFELRAGAGTCSDIGALLIESAGENAVLNNTDLFVKRDRVTAICPHCAITAVLTLQVNAPAGGAGHRTGLRGGGPLTTLVLCQPQRSLWHDLWLNVLPRPVFLEQQGDARKTAAHYTFPWLAEIGATQTARGETSPRQVHPHHVYWAMPRRIRLDFETTAAGDCDLCARFADKLVRQYETKNYGLNYKGPWEHPLSPHYETKEGWLPVHAQPGGIGYRHWLPWVFGVSNGGKKRSASVLSHFREHRGSTVSGQLRLWAFGYDMDKMKARCWYEASLPLYGIAGWDEDAQRVVEAEIGLWLAGADMAVQALRKAVRKAWFSRDARGDFSAVDASFWSATERPFYRRLEELLRSVRAGANDEPLPARSGWHRQLVQVCDDVFEREFVGAGAIERQNPARVVGAKQELCDLLHGKPMRKTLGLPEPARSGEKAKSRRTAHRARHDAQ